MLEKKGEIDWRHHIVMNLMIIAVIFSTFMAYEIGYIKNPFKIIDPSHPNFNPKNFRPQDYDTVPERLEAFKRVIPSGMRMDDVEALLNQCCRPDEIIEQPTQEKNTKRYKYIYKPWFSLPMSIYALDSYQWRILITYDDNDKVTEALIYGP